MSLILEALRKLEREKPAPDRGVVVMTSAAWADARSRRGPWLWLTLGLAAGVAGAIAILEWRRPPTQAIAPVAGPPTVTAPVPAPDAREPAPAADGAATAPRPVLPTPAPTARPRLSVAAPAPLSAPAAAAATTPPPANLVPPSPTPTAALVLQAITIRDGAPVALINDRVLREGDEIDGVRIVRIGEAEVEIERDGQREVLRF